MFKKKKFIWLILMMLVFLIPILLPCKTEAADMNWGEVVRDDYTGVFQGLKFTVSSPGTAQVFFRTEQLIIIPFGERNAVYTTQDLRDKGFYSTGAGTDIITFTAEEIAAKSGVKVEVIRYVADTTGFNLGAVLGIYNGQNRIAEITRPEEVDIVCGPNNPTCGYTFPLSARNDMRSRWSIAYDPMTSLTMQIKTLDKNGNTISELGGSTDPVAGKHKYNKGTSVNLSATAKTGYHFLRWEDNLSGTNSSVSITMDSYKIATAVFKADDNVLPPVPPPPPPTGDLEVEFHYQIIDEGAPKNFTDTFGNLHTSNPEKYKYAKGAIIDSSDSHVYASITNYSDNKKYNFKEMNPTSLMVNSGGHIDVYYNSDSVAPPSFSTGTISMQYSVYRGGKLVTTRTIDRYKLSPTDSTVQNKVTWRGAVNPYDGGIYVLTEGYKDFYSPPYETTSPPQTDIYVQYMNAEYSTKAAYEKYDALQGISKYRVDLDDSQTWLLDVWYVLDDNSTIPNKYGRCYGKFIAAGDSRIGTDARTIALWSPGQVTDGSRYYISNGQYEVYPGTLDRYAYLQAEGYETWGSAWGAQPPEHAPAPLKSGASPASVELKPGDHKILVFYCSPTYRLSVETDPYGLDIKNVVTVNGSNNYGYLPNKHDYKNAYQELYFAANSKVNLTGLSEIISPSGFMKFVEAEDYRVYTPSTKYNTPNLEVLMNQDKRIIYRYTNNTGMIVIEAIAEGSTETPELVVHDGERIIDKNSLPAFGYNHNGFIFEEEINPNKMRLFARTGSVLKAEVPGWQITKVEKTVRWIAGPYSHEIGTYNLDYNGKDIYMMEQTSMDGDEGYVNRWRTFGLTDLNGRFLRYCLPADQLKSQYSVLFDFPSPYANTSPGKYVDKEVTSAVASTKKEAFLNAGAMSWLLNAAAWHSNTMVMPDAVGYYLVKNTYETDEDRMVGGYYSAPQLKLSVELLSTNVSSWLTDEPADTLYRIYVKRGIDLAVSIEPLPPPNASSYFVCPEMDQYKTATLKTKITVSRLDGGTPVDAPLTIITPGGSKVINVKGIKAGTPQVFDAEYITAEPGVFTFKANLPYPDDIDLTNNTATCDILVKKARFVPAPRPKVHVFLNE